MSHIESSLPSWGHILAVALGLYWQLQSQKALGELEQSHCLQLEEVGVVVVVGV